MLASAAAPLPSCVPSTGQRAGVQQRTGARACLRLPTCYQSTASSAGRPCCVAATALLARLQAASAACESASTAAPSTQLDPSTRRAGGGVPARQRATGRLRAGQRQGPAVGRAAARGRGVRDWGVKLVG